MKLVSILHFTANAKRLVSLHGYNLNNYTNGWAWIQKDGKVGAYALCEIKTKYALIDWIYAKPGNGTSFLKIVEAHLFKLKPEIRLLVSIDPHEKKNTVKRRLNFYIKNNYRVIDITYHTNGRTTLLMNKYRSL